MDHNGPLQFIPWVSEAVFIDWLGAILDVSSAKFLTAGESPCGATARAQRQVLHHLRRLQVTDPPFDGERDAATMPALERLRAQSHMQIVLALSARYMAF
jgi:hypothetical protein